MNEENQQPLNPSVSEGEASPAGDGNAEPVPAGMTAAQAAEIDRLASQGLNYPQAKFRVLGSMGLEGAAENKPNPVPPSAPPAANTQDRKKRKGGRDRRGGPESPAETRAGLKRYGYTDEEIDKMMKRGQS